MYSKCELMDEANKVFVRMEVKDVVSWNAMVTGYSQIGRFEDALRLFENMRAEKIELNVVTRSAVIAGYAQRGHGYEALDVFRQMQLSGSEPNVVTLASLLSGCACIGALYQGKETHCYAVKCILNVYKNDTGEEMMVITSLIDMYAKLVVVTGFGDLLVTSGFGCSCWVWRFAYRGITRLVSQREHTSSSSSLLPRISCPSWISNVFFTRSLGFQMCNFYEFCMGIKDIS